MTAPTRRRARGERRGVAGHRSRLGVRARVAGVAAVAVAAAVVLSSAVVYIAVRHDLLSGLDGTLTHRVRTLDRRRAEHGPLAAIGSLPHRIRTDITTGPVLAQVVTSKGTVVSRDPAGLALPVGKAVRQVAAGHAQPYFADATVVTSPIRMYVTSFGHGYALEVARPAADLDAELGRLATALVVTSAAGVVVALALGAAVAGVALRPVRRLTDAAERVASSRDLAAEIDVRGRDELARLGSSINTMLKALVASHRAQRQLVADASHELRTPLTSLRTNVEVLAEATDMEPAARRQLVADLSAQLDALNGLLGDLVELARQDDPAWSAGDLGPVELDAVIDEARQRAQRNHPEVPFVVTATAVRVRGVAADLERAILNLLDNAAKWSPAGAAVELSVSVSPAGGGGGAAHRWRAGTEERLPGVARVTVRDHGPGVDADDLPHVFDRFYRGRGSQHVQGSGLGLAIVRRIVEGSGGAVHAEPAEGGGTCFVIRLDLWPDDDVSGPVGPA